MVKYIKKKRNINKTKNDRIVCVHDFLSLPSPRLFQSLVSCCCRRQTLPRSWLIVSYQHSASCLLYKQIQFCDTAPDSRLETKQGSEFRYLTVFQQISKVHQCTTGQGTTAVIGANASSPPSSYLCCSFIEFLVLNDDKVFATGLSNFFAWKFFAAVLLLEHFSLHKQYVWQHTLLYSFNNCGI